MLSRSIVLTILYLGGVLVTATPSQVPDHYYSIPDLPFKAEKVRLAGAAAKLRRHPQKIVYLVGYNKSGMRKSTTLKRLTDSKKYLIKIERISPDRIITVYGGSKDAGIIMDIFVFDRNSIPPKAKSG